EKTSGFKIATVDKKEIFKYLGADSVDTRYSFVNGQTIDSEWYVKCDVSDPKVAGKLDSRKTTVGLHSLAVSTDTGTITQYTGAHLFIR
ncbi:MAG: hypothetical protein IJ597_03540, partial [Synergistaceae bacterium]|nr:hypothetical protein [Synergistaceae bacterium]